jgi:hypothetical protein
LCVEFDVPWKVERSELNRPTPSYFKVKDYDGAMLGFVLDSVWLDFI